MWCEITLRVYITLSKGNTGEKEWERKTTDRIGEIIGKKERYDVYIHELTVWLEEINESNEIIEHTNKQDVEKMICLTVKLWTKTDLIFVITKRKLLLGFKRKKKWI